jgi:hypothetical protein
MIVLGADPGAYGAIAVLRDGSPEVIDMPVGDILVGKKARKRISPELMAYHIRELLPVDVAYVEEVASMPKQGIASAFTFGQAHGMLLGALAFAGIRTVRIRPQLWQNTVKAKGDPRPRALELYPGMAGELKRKKDEGRADAILIAHAGLLLERNQ